jgi:hypothetical protein
MEPDRQQPDGHATYVIAQHYSSTTEVSLRLHFRKEKFGALIKSVVISVFLVYLKGDCLKLCNLKTCKSRSVCTWTITFD